MGDCVLCKEQITNPLGPQRIEEEIATWLHESKPELLNKFFSVSDEIIPSKVESNDFCIVKGNPMNICAYCYTEHILRWLMGIKSEQSLIEEYFTFFDFDGQHLGYTRIAEEKGYVIG